MRSLLILASTLSTYLCQVSAASDSHLFSSPTVPPSERSALVELYQSTDGAHWRRKDHWGHRDPCQSRWYGIACAYDRAEGNWHVVEIDLSNNGLRGKLPKLAVRDDSSARQLATIDALPSNVREHVAPFLSESFRAAFPYLRKFDVSFNQLTDSIPESLGLMERLEEISLEANHLNSTLPPSLGKLTNLRTLNVFDNDLKGGLPETFCNLKRANLVLSGNEKIDRGLPGWLRDCESNRAIKNVIIGLGQVRPMEEYPGWLADRMMKNDAQSDGSDSGSSAGMS